MLSVQFQGTKGAGLPSTCPTWSPGVCKLEGRSCPIQAQPVSIQMRMTPAEELETPRGTGDGGGWKWLVWRNVSGPVRADT